MLFILVLLIVALDQVVKYWTVQTLLSGPSTVLIPHVFQLTYVENRGAAFSFLQDQIPFFVLVTAIVLAVIVYASWKGLMLSWIGKLSLVFIAGGAIGNLIDRIIRGYVVDMFYFSLIDFPVFNGADIFIVVGGVFFVYYVLVQHDRIKADKEGKREQNYNQ